ncbi:SpsF Spore coat polysaccharide biosynthesis protein F, CMP-KDO synthetase homolog [Oxalobacteraceae bacterium]
MTVGVVILCRYSSKRLPGKILLPIAGKPILTHIVERVRRSGLPVMVATSDQASDDAVEQHCRLIDVACFRGSLDNVAERFLRAAEAQGCQYATRINGDNLFVDPDLLREMAQIAASGDYEFVTNVPGRSYPPGSSIEIVDVKTYSALAVCFAEPRHREHVTLFLYDHPERCKYYIHLNPRREEMAGLNLAIDTEEDYLRAQRIVADLPEPLLERSLKEIINAEKRL